MKFGKVLKKGGIFIVNVSDHIRAGQVVPVVEWHRDVLIDMGMKLVEEKKVNTPRMGFGANRKARVQYEHIMVLSK